MNFIAVYLFVVTLIISIISVDLTLWESFGVAIVTLIILGFIGMCFTSMGDD
tara:strand:- start:189 stop:344 length:156 start_codon:yes stop_codon:yes gene_type:complete